MLKSKCFRLVKIDSILLSYKVTDTDYESVSVLSRSVRAERILISIGAMVNGYNGNIANHIYTDVMSAVFGGYINCKWYNSRAKCRSYDSYKEYNPFVSERYDFVNTEDMIEPEFDF